MSVAVRYGRPRTQSDYNTRCINTIVLVRMSTGLLEICRGFFFFLWRCNPTRVMTSSFLRFLDHTRLTTVGRTPLDERSARRRNLYLTTHNIHNRQTSSFAPCGIRTHDLSRRAATDLRHKPRGHWDRQRIQINILYKKQCLRFVTYRN